MTTPGEEFPALPGIDVKDLYLQVVGSRNLNVDVRQVVTRASLTRTITGSSTLELELVDEKRTLLRSGRLTRTLDVNLDGLWFRLTHVGKQGDQLQLTLEARGVARLRTHKKPRKASRADVTRAQFAYALVREEKLYPLKFWAPELRKRQPIGSASREQRDTNREGGIDTGANLTVKGQRANRRQIRNAETMLQVAADVNAGTKPTLALIAAGIVEAELLNVRGSGADAISFGVIQNIPGTSMGVDGVMTKAQALDVAYSAKSALLPPGPTSKGGLIKLHRDHKDWTIGQLAATAINGGGDPQYAQKVNAREAEAQKYLDAFGGGFGDGGGGGDTTRTAKYEFSRGEPGGQKGEDTWTALQRLAGEVGWVCFEVANTIFFVAEEDLYRGRSRATLSEANDPVVIDFDRETNARLASQATITLDADRWAAPPGSVIKLTDCGPADGRWLVEEISRQDLFDSQTTITLKKPAEELPEPRGEQETSNTTGSTAGGDATSSTLDGVQLGSEWAGTKSIFDQFVTPFMQERGLRAGSAKRTPAQNAAVGGASRSEHLTTNTTAYAVDYPTNSGESAARSLAEALGWRSWQANSYATHDVTIDGKPFTVQILWGAGIEHGDHVHVGIHRKG